MTVQIISSLRVALVSGTGVKFDAPVVVPYVTTDDIYMADNPSETLSDQLAGLSSTSLLATASVDATHVGTTSLYSIPAGYVIYPTMVIFGLTAISGTGATPLIDLGYTGSFKQIIDSSRMSGQFNALTVPSQILSVFDFTKTAGNSGADYKYIPSGNPITLSVETQATYTAYTLKVYLFGLQIQDPGP